MTDKQLNPEELIIVNLKEKINVLEKFFDYFNLSEINFSKALINELEMFVPKIKTSQKYFTAIEKENIVFLNEGNSNDQNRSGIKEDITKEEIEVLIKILKRMNLELKYQQEKLSNDVKVQKINYDKKHFDPMFNDILKKCREELVLLEKKIQKSNKIPDDKAINVLNQVDNVKNDIKVLYEENCSLNRTKEELKVELKKYSNLPTDVNQIRTLIEIKKEELKALMSKRK